MFPAFQDKLDQELLGNGDKVNYVTLPGVQHGNAVAAGDKTAPASLAKWFR